MVVREVFELDLVGQAAEPLGESRADDRVRELPDLAHRVAEGAVAVDERLDLPAGRLAQLALQVVREGSTSLKYL